MSENVSDVFGPRAVEMLERVRNQRPEVSASRGVGDDGAVKYVQQHGPEEQRDIFRGVHDGMIGGEVLHLSPEAKAELQR